MKAFTPRRAAALERLLDRCEAALREHAVHEGWRRDAHQSIGDRVMARWHANRAQFALADAESCAQQRAALAAWRQIQAQGALRAVERRSAAR